MEIKTQRLVLREFVPEDGEDLYEILGDRETMHYSEPPYSRERTQAFLKEFCIRKKGALAVEKKGSGKVIGYLLFHPLEVGAWELGWFFNRAYWRQGYAWEACSAIKEYAFTKLDARKIVAETIDREKSVPLMEKLGMKREGTEPVRDLAGNWTPLYLYAISREDVERA